MDLKRRALSAGGAAVAAAAAVPRVFGLQPGRGKGELYEKGAPFAFTTSRPGPASRSCYCRAAD